MTYKMIYHLPHKFKIESCCLRHLRTFSLITREIYVETTNKAHNFNLLIEPALMMSIYIYSFYRVTREI